MTSSQYVLYTLGYTRATKVQLNHNSFAKNKLIAKLNYGSTLFLKLETDKMESLVIAG